MSGGRANNASLLTPASSIVWPHWEWGHCVFVGVHWHCVFLCFVEITWNMERTKDDQQWWILFIYGCCMQTPWIVRCSFEFSDRTLYVSVRYEQSRSPSTASIRPPKIIFMLTGLQLVTMYLRVFICRHCYLSVWLGRSWIRSSMKLTSYLHHRHCYFALHLLLYVCLSVCLSVLCSCICLPVSFILFARVVHMQELPRTSHIV
jgi:hypothetical protein